MVIDLVQHSPELLWWALVGNDAEREERMSGLWDQFRKRYPRMVIEGVLAGRRRRVRAQSLPFFSRAELESVGEVLEGVEEQWRQVEGEGKGGVTDDKRQLTVHYNKKPELSSLVIGSPPVPASVSCSSSSSSSSITNSASATLFTYQRAGDFDDYCGGGGGLYEGQGAEVAEATAQDGTGRGGKFSTVFRPDASNRKEAVVVVVGAGGGARRSWPIDRTEVVNINHQTIPARGHVRGIFDVLAMIVLSCFLLLSLLQLLLAGTGVGCVSRAGRSFLGSGASCVVADAI